MKKQAHLFSPLHQPYYVYSPHYHQTSGGARALHYLCHALNLIGEEAYALNPNVNPELRTPVLTQEIIGAHAAAGRSPIAIYPEVVSDNPFNARNVVRYLLAEPGIYTGKPIDLQPRDLVCTFGPSIVPEGWSADPLRIPLVDTRLFNSVGVDDGKRKGSAVFIHRHLNKGGSLLPVTTDAIEISYRVPERSAQELASIFRQVECLYMYEHSTVCFEALLCGCPVVYLLNAVSLPESFPWMMQGKGIAWSLEPADIARAKKTVHEAALVYQEENEVFWEDLHRLVEKSQRLAVDRHGQPILRRTAEFPAAHASPTTQVTPATPARPTMPTASATGSRKKRIVVYTVESPWSPCPQIRLIRPFAHLEQNWELEWGIKDGQVDIQAAQRADLIILHRFTPGLLPVSALETIFASGKPVIYESDDLLNEIPADHPEAAAGASWKEGIEYTIRRARAVVVSTAFLADKYRPLNPAVHVLPNHIDFDLFFSPVPEQQEDQTEQRITIGLLGSSIQPSNFALVDEALRALCEKYQERLNIHFVGWTCPSGWENHPRAQFTPFIDAYLTYAAQLRQMHWDIALIPLADDDYNQCKSHVKWLDYSAAGIASIFSDIPVYRAVVTHERTGLLLPNASQAWLAAITRLIESPEQRRQLAARAQEEVRRDHGLPEKAALCHALYSSFVAIDDVQAEEEPALPPASTARDIASHATGMSMRDPQGQEHKNRSQPLVTSALQTIIDARPR